ncbi:MAG: putative lipid II flippase FtsW [Gammaproteobacteria bacterium]|nr:putative lipid II flippase FtsW [Gammaproteobacteria bacterium]
MGGMGALKLDRILIISVAVLLCLGLLMVASASMLIAENNNLDPFHFVIRHGISICIAVCSAVVIYQIPMGFWERISGPLFFLALLVLVLVLVFGITVNGSTRWVSLGVMNFQPSEIAKIFVLIYIASFIVRKRTEVQGQISGILKPVVILFIPAVLLLAEPDFGSVIVLSVAAFVMLFMGGVRIKYFALLVVFGAVLFYVLLITQPYRVARLSAFLHPWENQYGSGYQLVQSLIAYGRGGWVGQGYGSSIQKLLYLPEAHTDFLISVFAEELGLMGMLFVISLFSALIFSALFISRTAEKRQAYFSAYLGYGLGTLVGIQAVFNLGVSMGLLPTKGLTLPLMSYGGSSLLSTCFLLAILLRINKENVFAKESITVKRKTKRKKKPASDVSLQSSPLRAAL